MRGYTDPDALEGKVDTSSPTTTRLARSALFCLAATCRWRVWTADVSTPMKVTSDNTSPKSSLFGPNRLCGIVIMHVDDMLGAEDESSEAYNKTISELKGSFSFREWKDGYCGCELNKVSATGWKLSHGKYLKKVKPISYDRKRDMSDSLTEAEVSQLRGLLGSLQWPSVQSSPHLQASTSLLSGQVGRATGQTLADANRLLKFAKENSDIGLTYEHIGEASQLRLVCFFDAAVATRAAGYLIMMVNEQFAASRRARRFLPHPGLAIVQNAKGVEEFLGSRGSKWRTGC